MKLVVAAREQVAEDTIRVRLAGGGGAPLPAFEPGAHIEVTVGGLLRRYSLTSSPHRLDRYEICVLHTRPSRGGSAYVHERLQVGDHVDLAGPFNAFRLVVAAAHSVFIAGGIGVTPFLSMMEALRRAGRPFELHYAARSRDRLLPLPRFAEPAARYVDEGGSPGLDVQRLLRGLSPGSDIYVCGPRPLIEAVRTTAAGLGWPPSAVHFESFGAGPQPGDRPVAVRLARSGATIEVRPGMSILDGLLANGVWAAYECRRGECASCVTEVLDGEVDHRDVCLTPEQRRHALCTCVSWARSRELTLDL